MREIICGIYKIASPSGRIYIGESKNIDKRILSYKGIHSSTKRQPKLHNSIVKYGWEAHTFEIIEECDFNELKCRERYWQDFYDVLNGGLNCQLTRCGEVKMVWSEESRAKISKGNKGRIYTEEEKTSRSIAMKKYRKTNVVYAPKGEESHLYNKTGVDHPCYGRKQTEEEKKKRIKSREYNSINNSQIIILDLEIGVFYYRIQEAAEALEISYNKMSKMLRNEQKNKTKLIYV